MSIVAGFARIVLALLALRGLRWAYVSFIVLALAYFPMHAGFHFSPRACELVFGPRLAVHSLTNFPHIVLFALFFIFSAVHFGGWRFTDRTPTMRAALMTLFMGAMVEIGEGVTGSGNCRLRDLIPDSAGLLIGLTALAVSGRVLATFRPPPTRTIAGRL